MKYQVGSLQYFREDDPEFDDKNDALKHAIALSYNDSPIGVWTEQSEDSELLAIVYMQEIFKK